MIIIMIIITIVITFMTVIIIVISFFCEINSLSLSSSLSSYYDNDMVHLLAFKAEMICHYRSRDIDCSLERTHAALMANKT